MKYAIFQINDRRQKFIDSMQVQLNEWDQVAVECVNGSNWPELEAAQIKYPYEVKWPARRGHLGIWYTVLNALEHAPLVTFEDDAVLKDAFVYEFDYRSAQIPEDFDFFSLFIPRDSDHLYNDIYNVSDTETGAVCKTYQRYGGVSMYYSKKGAAKIKALLERDGLTGQYDDTLYKYAKEGELNGYCSKPTWTDLVYITGYERSLVQETDYA